MTMKRIFMFMAMALGVLAFQGCDPQDTPTEEPKEETPALQSFEVNVDGVTETTVTYTVTPAILDKEYLAVVKTAASVAGLEDEALVESVFADVKAAAEAEGVTFDAKMAKLAVKGVSDKVVIEGLADDSEYALIVFGVDPAKAWEFTTFPEVREFKTNAYPVIEYTFDVTTTVENNTVSFKVVPSDNTVAWHLLTVTKEMYDYYLDPAAYAWTKDQFYQAYVESELNSYAEAGYTNEQILAAMFLTGEQSLFAEGLNANTEYVYLIAAFVIDGNNLQIASEVGEGTYTTGDVAKTELTFDISVTDVEQMRAAIKITPSDLSAPFCWIVQAYDGVSTPDQVMNGIVEANKMWLDMGFMSSYGVQDYTGGPGSPYKYKVGSPDTDFCVIAFGYAGGVTSEPNMVTFHTLPGGDPADCTFDAVLNETTTYGFSFTVTPSDPTVYYYGDVCLVSEYDETAVVAMVEEGIQQMYEMNLMFNPTMTMADMVSSYYWNGTNVMTAENLDSDTEYTMYILALDQKTGKVAKAHAFPAFAKTRPAGTVVPEQELIGYFSGNDENGAVFGQPAATAGKCIAVVKYNADPTATAVYGGILSDDGTDTEVYPDATIFDYLKFYWQPIDMTQPYSFFLIDWDSPQTAFAYALDANGGQGGIDRLLLNCAEADKTDINVLFDLVNQVYGTSSTTATAASLDVKEADGKPRVTVREMEANTTVMSSEPAIPYVQQMTLKTGNLMQLDFLPTFWAR